MTLVVANKTSSGEELIEHLKAKAADDEPAPVHRGRAPGRRQRRRRRARRARAWRGCSTGSTRAGLLSSGMIGDPDPYTAAMNALELFRVDDVVISTLPDERSGWMRSNLIERVRNATRACPSSTSSSTPAGGRDRRAGGLGGSDGGRQHRPRRTGHAEHHGPPPANRSSRVEPQLLGMLLFIISEMMVFGAFFTAYFFIRVAQGDPWPAHRHDTCRSRSPGVNTAILVSSSFTIHWARDRRSRTATASA